MLKASAGGGVAAPTSIYRHTLVRLIIPLLGPLDARRGWSPLALALAAMLMSLDAAPTLAQRFESVLSVLDRALPRRLSVAATLATVRRSLHGDMRRGTLERRLRRCTLEPPRRRTSKAAYRWPHKKNPAPPRPPIIANATRTQVALARRLAHQSTAA